MKAAIQWIQGTVGLVLVVALVACGGGEEATQPTAAETSAEGNGDQGNPLTAPVDYLGAVNQAQKTAGKKISLVGIQQAVQQFQIMEDRLPRNLQEVVSSGYISRLPEVPRGQKLTYNPQTGVVSTAPSP